MGCCAGHTSNDLIIKVVVCMERRLLPSVSAVLMFLGTLCVVSCSVKEHRCDCPSWLQLDYGCLSPDRFSEVALGVVADGGFRFEDIVSSEQYGRTYIIEVPRKRVSVNVRSGDGGLYRDEAGVVIPTGSDCPPLYMYGSSLEYTSELRRDTVRLHKSYSMLSIRMLRDDGTLPYSLSLEGNVCGYNADGSVMGGDFRVYAIPDGDGKCWVRIPRQNDSSLIMKVDDSGKVRRTFALGEYIASSGFDWMAPDLEDIDVTINFSLMSVSITVGEWTTVVSADVEI